MAGLVVLFVVGFGAIAVLFARPDLSQILIGIAVWFAIWAIAAALAWWTEKLEYAVLVGGIALPLAELVALALILAEPYWVLVVVVSLVAVWLTVGAFGHWSSPGASAVVLFLSTALWSGTLGFVSEIGRRTFPFETAVDVRRSQFAAVEGLYLGRTAKQVLLASKGDKCRAEGPGLS
jgi:hypothetical protein